MRLIDTITLTIDEFHGEKPRYAILSHTWGKSGDELTLQEMLVDERSKVTTGKPGFEKLVRTCEIARSEYSLEYAWIDTCCIDKTSSAELSESINSMFRWYQEADVCIAFLADMEITGDIPTHVSDGIAVDMAKNYESFRKSRWWTRGWTLQELVAPRTIAFYDKFWVRKGSRSRWANIISQWTGIPSKLLKNQSDQHLDDYPIAMRMSWASQRETTREEDLAYCLLGIFDINMPLLYGEGSKAFIRLQEEIIKQHNDLSIFAWEDKHIYHDISGLLAASPQAFESMKNIEPDWSIIERPRDFSVTNQGICFRTGVFHVRYSGTVLFLQHKLPERSLCIHIASIGPNLHVRRFPRSCSEMQWCHNEDRRMLQSTVHVPKILPRSQLSRVDKHTIEIYNNLRNNTTSSFLFARMEPPCLQGQTMYTGYKGLSWAYMVLYPLWAPESELFVAIFLASETRQTGEEFNLGVDWSFTLLSGSKFPVDLLTTRIQESWAHDIFRDEPMTKIPLRMSEPYDTELIVTPAGYREGTVPTMSISCRVMPPSGRLRVQVNVSMTEVQSAKIERNRQLMNERIEKQRSKDSRISIIDRT
ncbi:heterokaryon incompatibility protein-domain-containing protein [Dendryphion nanum]|uniref:Heterokaryon incompatibility protein-domain-containing protein n=1 Tax=Dendryphion nanum TaxID=256645 RepID=A0A9P9IDR7_9PLEO|nr:heterokaryon incompatibility protein-domain-containing protein [Dendryphion nanum]